MRHINILIIISIFMFGCNSQKEVLTSGKTYSNFRGFEPIDPIEYDDNVFIVLDDSIISKEMKIVRKEKQNLTTDNDANWKKLYAEILNNYSWKLSIEVLSKLRELSK